MTRHHISRANAAVNLASLMIACLIVIFLLPSNYNSGGGAVAFAVLVTAFVFRLLIQSLVKEFKRNDDPR